MVNNYLDTDGEELTVNMWLDFIGHRTDLRQLDRPYDAVHKQHYQNVWSHIELQVGRLASRYNLPASCIFVMNNAHHQLYYRYA